MEVALLDSELFDSCFDQFCVFEFHGKGSLWDISSTRLSVAAENCWRIGDLALLNSLFWHTSDTSPMKGP